MKWLGGFIYDMAWDLMAIAHYYIKRVDDALADFGDDDE